jgi:hypothetical protein
LRCLTNSLRWEPRQLDPKNEERNGAFSLSDTQY